MMERKWMHMWFLTLLLFGFLFGCDGSDYDFNFGSNDGWERAGLYEDGTINPIWDYFGIEPAAWVDGQNAPTAPPAFDPLGDMHGCIALGAGGLSYPVGPGGYWAWHFNSPDLSGNSDWQNLTGIQASLVAVMDSNYRDQVWAEFCVLVRKPDTSVAYYSDWVFHPLPLNQDYASNSWQTFTLSVSGLGIPAGSTLLNVNIRIFGQSGSHDGYVLLDNVHALK